MIVRPCWLLGLVCLGLSCSDDKRTPTLGTAGVNAGGATASAGMSGAAGSSSVAAGSGGSAGSQSQAGSAGAMATGGSAGSSGGSAGSAGSDAQGEVVIASGQMVPTGIAIDDSSVYWANRDAGSIVKCPLAGCGAAEPTLLASNVGQPLGLAVDDENFYWMTPDGKASSCPLSGCTGVPKLVLQLVNVNKAIDVRVVGDDLYFAAWPYLGFCPASGCVEAGPTLFERTPAVSLDSNADRLFVAKNSGIISCSLADCLEPVTLTAAHAVGLSIDASHVYFAESSYLMLAGVTITPAISRCPLAGCAGEPPEVVVSGDVSPFGVVVSATRIFYTNYEHGTVVSTPKLP